MLKPGNYLARVVDHDIRVVEGKDPQASVTFSFVDDEGSPQKLMWFGSFHPNAREFTIKSLVLLGMPGENPGVLARDNGEGHDLNPVVLNTEQDFELVVEHNTYNGKTSPRIKYINLPGRSAQKRSTAQAASAVFSGMSLSGYFAQAREGMPKTEDKIPF